MFEVHSGFETLERSTIAVYNVTVGTEDYERMCVWMINSMLGRRCIIKINGNPFRFDTPNERVMWAQGFQKALSILASEKT